jgi:hypothetical protein
MVVIGSEEQDDACAARSFHFAALLRRFASSLLLSRRSASTSRLPSASDVSPFCAQRTILAFLERIHALVSRLLCHSFGLWHARRLLPELHRIISSISARESLDLSKGLDGHPPRKDRFFSAVTGKYSRTRRPSHACFSLSPELMFTTAHRSTLHTSKLLFPLTRYACTTFVASSALTPAHAGQ